LVDALDADVVFDPGPEAGPYRGTFVGRSEVRAFFKRLSKTVRKFNAEPLKALTQGEEVFVLAQLYGRFSRGVEAWLPVIHRWTFEGGRIVGLHSFPGRGKSLEALVLELQKEDSLARPAPEPAARTASSRPI
jgi:SnoaL-like protein